MRNIKVFDSGEHQFILLNESDPGEEHGIRSNQYLILHQEEGVLLDPGGFGVMPRVLAEMLQYISPEKVKAIVLSHQDPDIVAGLATWIEITKAPIYTSHLWVRFLPHYGIRAINRFVPVPDEGMPLVISPFFQLQLVPAHFLHSEGQINVYDPYAKVLFSGDIGAACMPNDVDHAFVDDFQQHLPYVVGFHRRYMCNNHAARMWAETIAPLDIEIMAPQHGPIYKTRAFHDFVTWFQKLKCGTDLLQKGGEFRREPHP